MAAAKLNLYCEQGATFSRTLTLTPGDLTGYAARGQVRDPETGAKVVDLTCSVLTVTEDEDTGVFTSTFTVGLTSAQTAALTTRRGYRWSDVTRYTYDVEVYLSTTVQRVINGDFVVSPEATK